MIIKKKEHPNNKINLHPRNKHRGRYELIKLSKTCPELKSFVTANAYQDLTIDFFNPLAVKMLNKALLKEFYDVSYWDIPDNYLCPTIPGRADYIHYIADLLSGYNDGIIPTGQNIQCLDIGIGANCIYPIIGLKEYGWSFIGTDIDPVAIKSATQIIKLNTALTNKIKLRLQPNPNSIFDGIIHKNEFFDIVICNPPFHSSMSDAQSGTRRKIENLKGKKIIKPILNFGGQSNELWCEGGEIHFVKNMISQSKQFSTSCFWFSTLISKQAHLKTFYQALKKSEAVDVKTIPMSQGNKISRILAWTFLSPQQQKNWIKRWEK